MATARASPRVFVRGGNAHSLASNPAVVIEKCRGPKENDWSWNTRRKFIEFHYMKKQDKQWLNMLNSYAWVLVNAKILGCRYDPAHMAELNVMAEQAEILGDLDQGGPTPQILPPSTGRGRGRGGRGGHGPPVNNHHRFPVGENGSQIPSTSQGVATFAESAPPPSVGSGMWPSQARPVSDKNGNLDGSPVPASSFFQHDQPKPRIINPAGFSHGDMRGRGRDLETLTPDEEVAQLTKSDEDSDPDNGVGTAEMEGFYPSEDTQRDQYFDSGILEPESLSSENGSRRPRPPSHPEIIARSLSDLEEELIRNSRGDKGGESFSETILKSVEDVVGPAVEPTRSSTSMSVRVTAEVDHKTEEVGQIHASEIQLKSLAELAPRNAFLSGLLSAVQTAPADTPVQEETIYPRSTDPAVLVDPAIISVSRPNGKSEQQKQLDEASRALKKLLFLPAPNSRPGQCAADKSDLSSVLSSRSFKKLPISHIYSGAASRVPVSCTDVLSHPSRIRSLASHAVNGEFLRRFKNMCGLPCDDEAVLDALSFLKKRPRDEVIVRLRGEFVESEAFRILKETIDANQAHRFILCVAESKNRNGHMVNECVVVYASQRLLICHGSSVKAARNAAAWKCLTALVKCFPTVAVAASESAFTQPVSRDDLLSGRATELVLDKVDSVVSSKDSLKHGFGYRLLVKFGWEEGKGLGKNSSGIVDPVAYSLASSYTAYGKRGLGFRDAGFDHAVIIDRAENLFQCFLVNAVLLDDLVFTSEFSAEEREVIHSAAEKYGLSHNSLGSGVNRHLVVRCKFTIQKLVEELRRVGGKVGRYELVEPP